MYAASLITPSASEARLEVARRLHGEFDRDCVGDPDGTGAQIARGLSQEIVPTPASLPLDVASPGTAGIDDRDQTSAWMQLRAGISGLNPAPLMDEACCMPSGRPLRVLVVDDKAVMRRGLRDELGDIEGVDVVGALDFEDAFRRDGWDDVDWVIIDVAAEKAINEQTPAVPVIERIRALCPAPAGPMIVAVTGNPAAYSEPLILRRLVEADPDVGLLWLLDLDDHLLNAASSRELDDKLRQVPGPKAPDEIPELGIRADTRVNRVVDGARELRNAVTDRRNERKTYLKRHDIARDANLVAATGFGDRPLASDIPGLPQYGRIAKRADLPETPGDGE